MKKISAKSKIGIVTITDRGELIKTDDSKTIFFRVEPSNLSVLSETSIRTKIINLAKLDKVMGGIQMYALDDRENYSANRKFIRDRIDEETIPEIRQILEKEEKYIKTIEADSSSARIFLISFRIVPQLETKIMNELNHFKQLASQSQLSVQQLNKEDIKKLLAVYFKHDTTSDTFPDIDGGDYYNDVDFDLLESKIMRGETESKSKRINIPLGK